MNLIKDSALNSPLGKSTPYGTTYNPQLLFPIPRQEKRGELGLPPEQTLPFFGMDIWNAYELSWLNVKGKPQVGILNVQAPANSSHIIESKSFKLYLNSFNQTRLASTEALIDTLQKDLSHHFGASVHLNLIPQEAFSQVKFEELEGVLIDRLDIEVTDYTPQAHRLSTQLSEAIVEEKLVSHLLKSNCLVTHQPDWASVQIHYVGTPINQENLLRYLIGFRNHNEFHEQCVERIFMDIWQRCRPQKLSVYARYTRRGGLDINPWRSNFSTAAPPSNHRSARQ